MQEFDIKAAIDEAIACFGAGDFARAEEIYRRVLASAPRAPYYADLGVICKAGGKHDEAIALLQKAVELQPKSADYHFKLGHACFKGGKHDAAFRAWSRVLELNPRHPDALSWLGCLHLEAGRLDTSIAHFRQAIAANPGHYHAHDNLGIALRKSGEPAAAIEWHRRAIALKPEQPEAYTHLGTTLSELDRFDEAIACHRRAIAADPAYAVAHCNLGNACLDVLRPDDAIASHERALELEPANAGFRWNYSNALLLAGRYDQGWREYEWRWRAPELRKRKPGYPGPEWHGEDIAGTTMLLYEEQGFGDAIQFIRYAALVAARGARVLLVSHPELARLLAGAAGVSRVICAGQPLPAFDMHVPLPSLPFLLGTSFNTIPAAVPYLRVDDALVEAWRRRTGSRTAFRVGLIWGGRKTHRFDRKRSCALSDFAPLARIEGVRFYSLQKGDEAAQAKSPPPGMSLADWTGELRDFADTAALMENLDLVISVDTAGVHLAGALGRPVWLLNRYQTEWRWLLDREDSPWYPTMRIFRQAKTADWPAVMERVAGELEKLVHRTVRSP